MSWTSDDPVIGFYAYKRAAVAFHNVHAMSPGWCYVAGAAAMWGQVVEHEYGWRAEYAQAVAVLESDDSGKVSDEYGLPVLSRDELTQYATLFSD